MTGLRDRIDAGPAGPPCPVPPGGWCPGALGPPAGAGADPGVPGPGALRREPGAGQAGAGGRGRGPVSTRRIPRTSITPGQSFSGCS
jgi:hypothetical protein